MKLDLKKWIKITTEYADIETLTVYINGVGATGTLNAYKQGKLVFVTGLLRPKLTGVDLMLASVVDTPSLVKTWAQCGGYANASQELYMNANSADIIFNVSAISDLKINFCYVVGGST